MRNYLSRAPNISNVFGGHLDRCAFIHSALRRRLRDLSDCAKGLGGQEVQVRFELDAPSNLGSNIREHS